MNRVAPLALCVLLAEPAAAHPALSQVGSMPAQHRALIAELKASQQKVDASLKSRKAKHDAWERSIKARDAAAAEVARLKKARSSEVEAALRRALALDEEANHARSALLAAEVEVAKGGAQLLKLYDALLVERRRAVEALPDKSSARAQAIATYKELAAQRDAVRQALLPVLAKEALPEIQSNADLDARPEDDVETLLEKADLARDLEERYLRQAEAVRRRILELEEEQAVVKDVVGMVGRSQLFDEEDRRLLVVRTELQPQRAPANAATGRSAEAGENLLAGIHNPPASESLDSAPSPAPDSPAPPSSLPVFSAPLSTPITVRAEQAFAAPTTDAAIAGLLSSHASVESLRALEKKLKDEAARVREKGKKLKSEAEKR